MFLAFALPSLRGPFEPREKPPELGEPGRVFPAGGGPESPRSCLALSLHSELSGLAFIERLPVAAMMFVLLVMNDLISPRTR